MVPILLGGCVSRARRETPTPPFVFRSLDLSFRQPDGRLAWELKAPEARYDLERRLVQAVSLQGVIYQKGKPLYRITAQAGTVLNDGELIQLEGQPRIQRLAGKATVITGQRLRWTPKREWIELEGEPMAAQQGLQIRARQALFQLGPDRLELRGQPTLRHWQNPPTKGPQPAPDVVVRVGAADWYPGSGLLRARGPAVAERRPGSGLPVQILTASGLEGNTERQELSLLAPVRFRDPGQDAQLIAQRTEVDLRRDLVSSAAPFEARSGRSQAWGDGFSLDLRRRSALVSQGCRLEQPGETLTAQQCRWNWQQGTFTASGSVQLQRRNPQQITRSSSLEGQIGKNAQAIFSTPGGRVHSTLRIPPPAPQRSPARPAIAL
ncbi:MAG: LPS export ABC transporter periplasmic protein LptC [Cyanobacteriota bacterium]|nr:LPS export ABC transporter periplasmic protein LptC [Cyanobacteriota bacterium]